MLRNAFCAIVVKKVYTLDFDRSSQASDSLKHVKALRRKLEKAKAERAIYCCAPESVKSLQLKYVDLLQQVESAPEVLFVPREALAARCGVSPQYRLRILRSAFESGWRRVYEALEDYDGERSGEPT